MKKGVEKGAEMRGKSRKEEGKRKLENIKVKCTQTLLGGMSTICPSREWEGVGQG
jgi:hypothetical protein